jgi:hypothetical protein
MGCGCHDAGVWECDCPDEANEQLEQAIYAAVYGAHLERQLQGATHWKLQVAEGDDAQENLDVWLAHVAKLAKSYARRAVQLHRDTGE